MKSESRVVITTMGVVSPIGIGKEEFFRAIERNQSGIKPITLFESEDVKGIEAGEITEFKAEDYLGKRGLRNLDRSTRLLLSATKLAMEESGREFTEEELEETGTIIGTGFGGVHSIGTFDRDSLENPNYVNPTFFPNTVINAPASQISIKYGIKKFNMTVSNLFTASTDAIGIAYNRIKSGKDKVIFTGGVEELCEEIFFGYYNNLLLDKKKDRNDGIVLGEGAVVFLLEELEHAKNRGANILAEITGYGTCCDAGLEYNYNKEAVGAVQAMRMALESSNVKPEEVDLISMSSNGKRAGEDMENRAISEVFGSDFAEERKEKVKKLTGECIGASGAMQIAAAIYALQEKKEASRYSGINTVIINSFGCNGMNSSLIVRKNS